MRPPLRLRCGARCLLFGLVAASLLACDVGSDSRPDAAPASERLRATAGPGISGATNRSGSRGGSRVDTSAAENPFRNFDLPEDSPEEAQVVLYQLLIENATTASIVVAATAGATPIVLDTLERRGQLRIDLRAPKEGLALDWRSIGGGPSGIVSIGWLADSVHVVRIEAETRS